MVNLCYRTFLQLVQEHYVYDIEAEILARDILKTITPSSEHSKFTKQYLSLYWTRERNLPKAIVDSSTDSKRKKACLDFFTDYIVPDINPVLEDDFYSRLSLLISNDDSITPRKKASLHTLASGDKGKYLTEVFLYSLTKINKDGITKLDHDTIPLLAQVDQKCPLCHVSLIQPVKDSKPIYRFTITRIYPEFLDTTIKTKFDSIKPKPINPDDSSNKICLCDTCSSDYLHDPTPTIYDKLIKLKKQSIFEGAAASTLAIYELEEKIVNILKEISDTDPYGKLINEFRMNPVDPTNKIPKDNYLLTKSIKDDNEVFYWFIKDYISQLDEFKSSFKIIASEIKTSFLKLEEDGHGQNEIFEALVDWTIKKNLLPASYKEAAHIVISYFVQNCEVFDEIS